MANVKIKPVPAEQRPSQRLKKSQKKIRPTHKRKMSPLNPIQARIRSRNSDAEIAIAVITTIAIVEITITVIAITMIAITVIAITVIAITVIAIPMTAMRIAIAGLRIAIAAAAIGIEEIVVIGRETVALAVRPA